MPSRQLTVEAVILNPAGQVLLVRQGETRRRWELPGGHVKKRESLVEGLEREVREETGLCVEALRVLGIFYIRKENVHDFVLVCRVVGRRTRPRANEPEISACGYFAIDALPEPIRPFTVNRIRDAIARTTHPLPIELKAKEWV